MHGRHLGASTPRRGAAAVWVLSALVILLVAFAVYVVWVNRRGAAARTPEARTTSRGTTAAPRRGVFPDPPHPRPAATGFRGCPPEGDGGDRALNVLKNRTDSADWVPVPLDSIVALSWPADVEGRRRSNWRRADAAAVARHEGIPVAVEGYLVAVTQSGPESPNCHGADREFRDWHMWLANEPAPRSPAKPDRTRALVAEPTPVIRAQHPGWTLAAMRRLIREGTPVRISGWLLLDPEHPDQVGKTRGTIWEIHPILRIEAKRLGRWVVIE